MEIKIDDKLLKREAVLSYIDNMEIYPISLKQVTKLDCLLLAALIKYTGIKRKNTLNSLTDAN